MGPQFLEHGPRQGELALGKLEALQQLYEVILDDIARNRLAVADALTAETQIVGMSAVLACGPAARKRLAAIGTHQKAPENEVAVEPLAARRLGIARETFEHAPVRL